MFLYMQTKKFPTQNAHTDQHTALQYKSNDIQIKLFRV